MGYAFEDLGEACATNNGHSDDGSDRTSTAKRLARARVVPDQGVEAGTLRLGVGSYTPGQYCHSTSPVPGLCRAGAVLTNQKRPFSTDGSGRLNYDAFRTLAHEMAHFFGVCPRENPHCLNAHSINELADIMVDDGRPAGRELGRMLSKFNTVCSRLYEDTLCNRVQQAPQTCGVTVPWSSPHNTIISGGYSNIHYQGAAATTGMISQSPPHHSTGSTSGKTMPGYPGR